MLGLIRGSFPFFTWIQEANTKRNLEHKLKTNADVRNGGLVLFYNLRIIPLHF